MTAIRKNFTYNLLLTISNIIFPIITFPYVSRIIGPAGIGKIQFVTTFVQNFILISALGIPIYGIREVAKRKGKPEELEQLVSELLTLNTITSLVLFVVYVIIILLIPTLFRDLKFYSVAVIMLLFSFSNVDWLFSGLERFKFIALRSVLIKFIALVFLFFFVQKKKDDIYYLWIIVGSYVINNVWNIYAIRNVFSLKHVNIIELKKHLNPLFYIFSTVAAISVYAFSDTLMLGFLTNYTYVGYYAAATRINKITIPVLTSLGTVLIPQIADAFKNDSIIQVEKLIKHSFDFVLLMGIPMTIGLMALAPELIVLFSGKQFLPSILPMQIFAPVVLIIGLSNVWAVQILTPAGKDKQVTISVLIGLVTSLILNIILIPHLGYVGAAISNVIAELFVMIAFAFFASKILNIKFDRKIIIQNLCVSLLFFPIISLLRNNFNGNNLLICLLALLICCVLFFSLQILLFKNEMLLKQLRSRFQFR